MVLRRGRGHAQRQRQLPGMVRRDTWGPGWSCRPHMCSWYWALLTIRDANRLLLPLDLRITGAACAPKAKAHAKMSRIACLAILSSIECGNLWAIVTMAARPELVN